MSDTIKPQAHSNKLTPPATPELAIVHAYQSVLHACGARVARQLLDEFGAATPAALDPDLYRNFLATTAMLLRYAVRV